MCIQICKQICMQMWSKILRYSNFLVHTNINVCMGDRRFPDAFRTGFNLDLLTDAEGVCKTSVLLRQEQDFYPCLEDFQGTTKN